MTNKKIKGENNYMNDQNQFVTEKCSCEECAKLPVGVCHSSDCEVHNEPAAQKGVCTCGALDKQLFKSLEEASKPLIDFLNENYNAMTIAIVTEGRVDVYSTEIGMPLPVRD